MFAFSRRQSSTPMLSAGKPLSEPQHCALERRSCRSLRAAGPPRRRRYNARKISISDCWLRRRRPEWATPTLTLPLCCSETISRGARPCLLACSHSLPQAPCTSGVPLTLSSASYTSTHCCCVSLPSSLLEPPDAGRISLLCGII